MGAIDTLRAMNRSNARKVPVEAPTSFLHKRWKPYVLTETGADRQFYELAVLTELKNGLRAGDVWVPGSRQFKDFEEYLVGREQRPRSFTAMVIRWPTRRRLHIYSRTTSFAALSARSPKKDRAGAADCRWSIR